MKNKKFLSLAFAIALLVTMVPASLAADFDDIVITGTVGGGVSITAGDDVSMTVNPTSGTIVHETDTNTLTVSNNDTAGFNVTVALEGADNGTTDHTLGKSGDTVVLDGTNGTIEFMSATSISDGTAQDSYTNYSASTPKVYSHANTNDSALVTDATITVTHRLGANLEVEAGVYTGTATYTIAAGA